jgi:hypothetical protein
LPSGRAGRCRTDSAAVRFLGRTVMR